MRSGGVGRQGDKETRRQGDNSFSHSPHPPLSPSPPLLVSPSPFPPPKLLVQPTHNIGLPTD
ncbi:hypothetical protein [Tolypothrix sp. VBCCA 56010]|uniref:hypothetical protein n=1 Tax=Tolypothrix sp. VBCCA 56010 TaxID=3137731 RepID=UPI003D7CFF6E